MIETRDSVAVCGDEVITKLSITHSATSGQPSRLYLTRDECHTGQLHRIVSAKLRPVESICSTHQYTVSRPCRKATTSMLNHRDFPPLPSHKRDQKKRKNERSLAKATPKRVFGGATSINSLPDELILEVFGYLPCLDQSDFQLPALINLSLTNRRLHALVVNELYAAYDSFFYSPYPFLRTVISDQQLANKVQSMTFKYGYHVHAERAPYRSSAADKKTIKEGLKVLDVPGWKAWASDCNEPKAEQEMLYAAILMHTPNIVSVDIDDGRLPYKVPKWLDLIRWAVNGSNIGHVHQFGQLKSIRVDVLNLKLRHLAPIFKLRSLRSLKLVGVMEPDVTTEGKADHLRRLVPVASSPIEDLSLQESFIDASALSTVIGFLRELKSLEYQHTDDRWLLYGESSEDYWLGGDTVPTRTYYPTIQPDYSNLRTDLERHHKSLKSLSLGENMEYTTTTFGLIGSLRIFENLTHLDVPLSALVNLYQDTPQILVENMPRSLQKLTIHIGSHKRKYGCIPAVHHMAVAHREYMPTLQEVRLVPVDDSRSYHSYDWEAILKPLSEQGINLVIDEALETLLPDESSDSLSDSDDSEGGVIPVHTLSVPDSDEESDEESLHSL